MSETRKISGAVLIAAGLLLAGCSNVAAQRQLDRRVDHLRSTAEIVVRREAIRPAMLERDLAFAARMLQRRAVRFQNLQHNWMFWRVFL